MHSIGEGLKAWRERGKLSQKDAATRLGVPYRTYQDYERDVKAPGANSIDAFIKAGISADWLIGGRGKMLLSENASKDLGPLRANESRAGYVAIALYNDVRAAAGAGAVVEKEVPDDVLVFKEDWVRFELGAKPQDLQLIRVAGDSMEPTLRSGDVILIDIRAKHPDREGVYIIRLGEMLLVKRLQALPGGVVSVMSDNPAFASFTVKLSDIDGNQCAIIGRVVWSGRRM